MKYGMAMANDLWLTDNSIGTQFMDDLRTGTDNDIDSTNWWRTLKSNRVSVTAA